MKQRNGKRRVLHLIVLTSICIISCCMLALAAGRHVEQVTVTVKGRNLTKKTYETEQGASISLQVSVSPKHAVRNISYRSSKNAVAAVNKKGTVTAKAPGTARITVSVTGKDKVKTTAWMRIRVRRKQAEPYKILELPAKRGNNNIYGVAYVPQGSTEKKPAVIYAHGFGGDYENGAFYARTLAQKGYVVYCFDFCGGGGSRSDGSALDMSIFTEQKDLEAVLQMLKKQSFVDAEQIFLLGASQGGVVSAITAAEHTDEIRGLILLYPAFVLIDDAKERFARVDEIPEKYFHMWMTVGKTYFENLLDYDVYEKIRAYQKDVLLIHGDADGIVPLSYSEKAVGVYQSAELKVIPGAGHGFYGQEGDTAAAWMLDYLESHRMAREK